MSEFQSVMKSLHTVQKNPSGLQSHINKVLFFPLLAVRNVLNNSFHVQLRFRCIMAHVQEN